MSIKHNRRMFAAKRNTPTPTPTVYKVYRVSDGTEVKEHDTITDFRGESDKFIACYDPRKILTELGEYYPGVYNLRISEYGESK